MHITNHILPYLRLSLLLMVFVTSASAAMAQRDEDENSQFHTSLYYSGRAEDLENANNWEAAKREIDAGLKEYPDDPELLYLNGRYYYYAQRDLQRARYNLVKALQESDHHWGARRTLIDVEDDSKHYSSAICYINELLEQQPYDRDLWRRKIALYNKLGNRVEAEAALERLSRIYPNDTIVKRDLALLHREIWNKRLASTTLDEQAATLEGWINTDPEDTDNYLELSDIYIKLGDYDKAMAAAKRGLVVFPNNQRLVQRVASLMSEQGLYTRALMYLKENRVGGRVYENAMREAANDARLRDAYDIHGRLYATTGDRDALNYLLNTSLTRGYYDDALGYLNEAYKLDGRTTALLMKEYDLQKRMNNKGAAEELLVELFSKNPDDPGLKEEYIAMQLELADIDEDQQDWEDAYDRLTLASEQMIVGSDQWAAAISRRINLLGVMDRSDEARNLYLDSVDMDPGRQKRFASAYEDIISKKIKQMIEDERYLDALFMAKELLGTIPESETGLRAAINMTQTLKLNDQFYNYAQTGFDTYPEQPYFVIKQAVALQQQDRYAEALAILNPQKPGETYPSQQLINPFSGVTEDFSVMLIKNKMPDLAIERIDMALEYDPDNTGLKYLKGVAYEQLKDYKLAYDYQSRYYNPSNAEQREWEEHMRYLRFRSFKNRIDVSYTSAYYDTRDDNLASIGHMYSLAQIAYSHLWKRHTMTAQVSYKASDGYQGLGGYETGGIGLEGLLQWDIQLNHRWNMMVSGSYGTKLFNKIGGNLQFGVDLGRGWSASLKGAYRLTPPMYLYDHREGEWIEGYQRHNLYMISPGGQKAWDRVILSANLDLISLDLKNYYYNTAIKGKIFVNEDNISSVAATIGFGSFPEITYFDQTTMNGITNMNAMVGLEGIYLITKNLFVGLSGTWNTYYNPEFTSEGYAVASYRNVYSINASLHLAF